jgi:hypothetical protein
VVQPRHHLLSFGAARQACRGAFHSLMALLAFLLLPVIHQFQLQGAATVALHDGFRGELRLRGPVGRPGPGHDPATCPICQASANYFSIPGVAITPDLDHPVQHLDPGDCRLDQIHPLVLAAGPRSPPSG